jgi:hypothetical protein
MGLAAHEAREVSGGISSWLELSYSIPFSGGCLNRQRECYRDMVCVVGYDGAVILKSRLEQLSWKNCQVSMKLAFLYFATNIPDCDRDYKRARRQSIFLIALNDAS